MDSEPVTLRPHRIGDVGWVVHRHAVIYAEEFGWNGEFEALVAEIGARFIREFDRAREAAWMAERGCVTLGAVFLVRQDDRTARLRMLYVEPEGRGLGIGRILVDACVAFARAAGYSRITLWTNDVLVAARRLYVATGFRLVAADPPALAFGQMMASETWELDLSADQARDPALDRADHR